MEFNFSINALFKERIVKIKNNLLPENYVSDRHGDGDVISKISTILDKMGIVSSKAQNLPRTLTSASKLQSSNHVVYLLADPKGNKGHGTVVGLLKVGPKKLFIYDKAGKQLEVEPLCVLDFYVHESKQRTGCGHILFEYMLQDQQALPEHLALDQPSESFLNFMGKHYHLDMMLPQNNGFVIYASFFEDLAANGNAPHSLKKLHMNPVQAVKTTSRAGHELPIYGRHSARRPESTMSQYMMDGGGPQVNGKSSRAPLAWPHLHQHRVPLTQYGHYWSTVGELLGEQSEESSTDGGDSDSVSERTRKISNIPIGLEGVDEDMESEKEYVANGHNKDISTTRDVRFKKTLFQNLSPFRR